MVIRAMSLLLFPAAGRTNAARRVPPPAELAV